MRFGSVVAILLISSLSFAQVNTYQYQNEKPGTSAELTMSRGSGSISTNAVPEYGIQSRTSRYEADILQLKLQGNIIDSIKYSGDFSFMKRNFLSDTTPYSVSGLGDAKASVWNETTFDTFVLNYGLGTSLAIAPARYEAAPTEGATDPKFRNNFSAYNSYSAFVGSNFTIGAVDAGVRGNVTYYEPRLTNQSGTYIAAYEAATTFGGEGYFELPIYRNTRVGLSMGFENSNGGFNNLTNANDVTASYSSFYGKYKIDADTSLAMSVTSQSRSVFYSNESTDLAIGVVRSL